MATLMRAPIHPLSDPPKYLLFNPKQIVVVHVLSDSETEPASTIVFNHRAVNVAVSQADLFEAINAES